MATNFDDRDELVCTEKCEYRGTRFKPGDRVLSDHPAAARLPECFRKLDPKRDDYGHTLREELQYRADQIERLERDAVAREEYFARRRRLGSEEAFWRDSADLLAHLETRAPSDLDRLPDPAREAEEEERVAALRRERLADPGDDRFWEETLPLLERHAGYNVMPAEIRELEDES